jgi:hypothetical protein
VQAAIKTLIGLGVALLTLAGCSRAPEPLIKVAARQTPDIPADPVQLSEDTRTPEAPSASMETPDASPTQALSQFKDPKTQAAVEDYQDKLERLQADSQAAATLESTDPLTDPAAITNYANQLGVHANDLDRSERAAKELMSPGEKTRFKALRKQLEETPED